MQPGDLVQSLKHKNSIGIVIEIFEDLGDDNPWVRVLFTHPRKTYQWVKRSGLTVVTEDKERAPDEGTPS